MIIIKTHTDIVEVRNKRQLPETYIDELEQYFKELSESMTGEEDAWRIHNLEEDGPIIVIEKGDDIQDLQIYGIEMETGGLMGTWPEFCNSVTLYEGEQGTIELWKLFLLLTNDFMLVFYIEKGIFGPKFDAWASEYIVDAGVAK